MAFGWKVAFTLDAGANVHLIYDGKDSPQILEWVERELKQYLENFQYYDDEILW
jgi:diphosphomevalonate decarboxylase